MSNITRIRNVFLDPQPKKSFLRICYEMLGWTITHKELPKFYFGHRIYHQESGDYKNYLSKRDYVKLLDINSAEKSHLKIYSENKLLFDNVLSNVGIRIPQLLGYKIDSHIHLKVHNRSYSIRDENKLIEVFEVLLADYKEIFAKPVNSYGGKNCFLITDKNIQSIAEKVMKVPDMIFQEKLVQHPDINRIYSHSINTLRFDSYIDDDGDAMILNSLIRFGANNSVVDNASSGGFFVNVDLESGRLFKKGMQFLIHGEQVYEKHPDSNVVFGGELIPFFDEAKELVLKALKTLPLKIGGWDIAITPDGPVIIEVNFRPMLTMSDTACGGYRKNEAMRELLKSVYS